MAAIVSLLRWNKFDGPGTLLGSGLEALMLGAFGHDALFRLVGRQKLCLDAPIELFAFLFRDVGGRSDDILSHPQLGQGSFGLPLVEQIAGGLESLLDVVGQFLAGDILGGLSLFDRRLGLRRLNSRRRRRRDGLPRGARLGVLERDPDHAGARPLDFPHPALRDGALGIKQQGFLEECLGRLGGPLCKGLTPQVGQLIGKGRIVGRQGLYTRQQNAAQYQQTGTTPKSHGSGHVQSSPAEGQDRLGAGAGARCSF